MKTLLFLIGLLIWPGISAQARPHYKTIYANDDRVEANEHPDALLRDYSQSVAAMVRDYRLLDEAPSKQQDFEDFTQELYAVLGEEFIENNPDLLEDAYDSYLVQGSSNSSRMSGKKENDDYYYFNKNRTLERNLRVCPTERFADQAVLSQCTGFLVAPDLLITAGHCIQTKFQCDSFRWVFGHKKGVDKIPRKDVYRCEKVVASELTKSVFSTRDYALIKLDRAVKGREPLPVRTEGYVNKDEPLAVIGHPSGLPMKIADNARVTSRRINFFYSNLDTFSGNSGSPVINTRTGLVEGLLIQGASDYMASKRGCRVSRLYSDDGDDEEKVFRLPRVDDLKDFMSGKKTY